MIFLGGGFGLMVLLLFYLNAYFFYFFPGVLFYLYTEREFGMLRTAGRRHALSAACST